ncbi:MAG: hypothetical protein M1600_11645 [Firmicutes bacterium]|jgi:hypothetical protein|nr:hypothetical protein [Bacillota bacterium]
MLFTGRDDWSTAEIIAAYRDAWHVDSRSQAAALDPLATAMSLDGR